MKKFLPLLAALAFVGAGCSSATPAPVAQPPAAPAPTTQPVVVEQPAANEVFIQDFSYKPASITVKKGTTVKWTNKDAAKHTASADSGKWASELLGQGVSYSHTFDAAGTFAYHCAPHPYMKGTVIVTE